MWSAKLVLLLPLSAAGFQVTHAPAAPPAPAPAAAELAGAWAGTVEHEGEVASFALELEPDADGKLLLKATVPAAHLVHAPLGKVPLVVAGNKVTLGPFAFDYDPKAKTLTGVVPAGFAPVYALPLRLRRVERVETPARPEPGGTARRAGVDLRRRLAALGRADARRRSRLRGGRGRPAPRRGRHDGPEALVVQGRRQAAHAADGRGRRGPVPGGRRLPLQARRLHGRRAVAQEARSTSPSSACRSTTRSPATTASART